MRETIHILGREEISLSLYDFDRTSSTAMTIQTDAMTSSKLMKNSLKI